MFLYSFPSPSLKSFRTIVQQFLPFVYIFRLEYLAVQVTDEMRRGHNHQEIVIKANVVNKLAHESSFDQFIFTLNRFNYDWTRSARPLSDKWYVHVHMALTSVHWTLVRARVHESNKSVASYYFPFECPVYLGIDIWWNLWPPLYGNLKPGQ